MCDIFIIRNIQQQQQPPPAAATIRIISERNIQQQQQPPPAAATMLYLCNILHLNHYFVDRVLITNNYTLNILPDHKNQS
jgi:hypothetical protein